MFWFIGLSVIFIFLHLTVYENSSISQQHQNPTQSVDSILFLSVWSLYYVPVYSMWLFSDHLVRLVVSPTVKDRQPCWVFGLFPNLQHLSQATSQWLLIFKNWTEYTIIFFPVFSSLAMLSLCCFSVYAPSSFEWVCFIFAQSIWVNLLLVEKNHSHGRP